MVIGYFEILTTCPKCNKSYSQRVESSGCPHKFLDPITQRLSEGWIPENGISEKETKSEITRHRDMLNRLRMGTEGQGRNDS
jgi:hypothetical protein